MSEKDCTKVTPILCDCTSTCDPVEPNTFLLDQVLCKLSCQIDIEADIELDQEALDIKDINKDVCITQCEFIEVTTPTNDCSLSGKMFLGGHVRKNIRYSTASCVDEHGICGEIRHCTVNVPFKCAIPITDVFPDCSFTEVATQSFHGRKLTQFDQAIWQPQNVPVECELNSVTINERDLYQNRVPISYGPKDEAVFRTVREKMVVNIEATLFQKRECTIPKTTTTTTAQANVTRR
ncbi:CsxC family protein [Chengkuizengella axinellae]|uniref:DUF7852 domain-containing protein n=1 Tax=Chengkuizengella axinellae TaxID=3064388 RepID=A0ABT9J2C9_9BACL|nr:hypothetical protein [Chengkuizengella sp. 2205SS18-9]MDP5275582.1 hypothetical protein [Chengkuizengella sp. 2205SS18-9]